MTDDEIIAIRKRPRFSASATKPWQDSIDFARDVLAAAEDKKRLAHEAVCQKIINEIALKQS